VKVAADYGKLATQRPSSHVVCFVRSNAVKAVVSAVRGQVIRENGPAVSSRPVGTTKCRALARLLKW
jgi:hypothetical protein